MDLRASLSDPERYAAQIRRLQERNQHRLGCPEFTQDGVSLASIFIHRDEFSRLLAATVASGEFEFRPATVRPVKVGTKLREIYSFCLTDRIVHGVLGRVMSEAIQPMLSPSLYSYVKGRTSHAATLDFACYVRAHRRSLPDPRTRGLYVLRRDVRDYTNAIPVDEDSPLFSALGRAFSIDAASRDPMWTLVQGAVRPLLSQETSAGLATGLERKRCGVPTGSPICPALYNVYLVPLDQELAKIPDGFYARYCDDLLFAHPDPNVTRDAGRKIEEVLANLSLGLREDKKRDYFLNGAGKNSDSWREVSGATSIPFLGAAVTSRGDVAAPPTKVRKFFSDLRSRTRRTVRALRRSGCCDVGALLCMAINQALHPASPIQLRSARLLRRDITDRSQLQQIDYRIARLVALELTGEIGVKAFRRLPYRKIREEWKLLSLVHCRDRKG